MIFWVDLAETGQGFSQILKPISPVPMIFLGGKGSGKTHIVRYFTYNVQRIRWGSNIENGLSNEKFIGIYFLLGGLNEGRFQSKGIAQEKWNTIFEYYMEITLAQRTLETLLQYLSDANKTIEDEGFFCKQITQLFTEFDGYPKTLKDLIKKLDEIRNKMDYQIDKLCIYKQFRYQNPCIARQIGFWNSPK